MATKPTGESLRQFAEIVASNPQLEASLKADPVDALNKVAANPEYAYMKDATFYRSALMSLAAVTVICLVGVIALALFNSINEAIVTGLFAVASAAVGGIAGLFTSSK
jgi:hypothetical protein